MEKKQLFINLRRFTATIALTAAAFTANAQTFTVADLEKMVDELKPYLAEDPRLLYPIKSVVETNPQVNANASAKKDPGWKEGDKFRATMTVFTGLMTHMKEARLVRAVVAHELAHLAKQHLGSGFNVDDLTLLNTRQKEYEADIAGSIALEKAGYSKQDMIDMLYKLDESSKAEPGSYKVLGDHADCARRAAAVGSNNLILRSMVSFQNAEAYLDARMYKPALKWFDQAAKEAPTFYESKYNAALAAISAYYDELADGIVAGWYTPDFGPSLLMPYPTSKAAVINSQDRENYQIAQERLVTLLAFDSKNPKSQELKGLVLVLDPDGTPSNLQAGIEALKIAYSKAIIDEDKLRIANNMAVGYQRTGNVAEGVKAMLLAQRTSKKYNPFVAVNLGQQPLPAAQKPDALVAEAVMYTYLITSPSSTEAYKKVKATWEAHCKTHNLVKRELEDNPVFYTRVLSLHDGGKTVNLYDPLKSVIDAFGAAENSKKYGAESLGMQEHIWQSGKFSVLQEARKIGDEVEVDVLRITSYNTGAYVELAPEDRALNQRERITVGMSQDDLEKLLGTEDQMKRNLVRMGKIEAWAYYPAYNIGVLIVDKKVAGITVAPVDTDE